MRWVLALVLALGAGTGVLYALSNGFTALTAEAARRQDVARSPRVIPPVQVLGQDGQEHGLDALLRKDGRVAIVNFFYTRCMALCLVQGSLTERLQQAIEAEGLQDRIRLISISFDPRDQADDLNRYAQRMRALPQIWDFYTLADDAQRDALLNLFGILVVPAPLGEFEHNAAFHVLTPDGRLARIVDLEAPGVALEAARELAGVPAGQGGSSTPAAGGAS